jgi:hypothetical protein
MKTEVQHAQKEYSTDAESICIKIAFTNFAFILH